MICCHMLFNKFHTYIYNFIPLKDFPCSHILQIRCSINQWCVIQVWLHMAWFGSILTKKYPILMDCTRLNWDYHCMWVPMHQFIISPSDDVLSIICSPVYWLTSFPEMGSCLSLTALILSYYGDHHGNHNWFSSCQTLHGNHICKCVNLENKYLTKKDEYSNSIKK